jgi:hypothetical protein
VDVIVDLTRVPGDDILSTLELVDEVVKLDKVHPVVSQIDVASVLVVLGSQEDFDNGVGFSVGIDVDLVGEGFVVETFLGNLHLEVVLDVFLRSDVDSVGQVGVVLVEIGDKTIEFDILDGDTFVEQILHSVGFVVLSLESEEVIDDFLEELVESGVAHRGLEVFKSGRLRLVVGVGLVSVAQQVASKHVVSSVELVVRRVHRALDQVTQDVETFTAEQFNFLTRFLQQRLLDWSQKVKMIDLQCRRSPDR